MGTMICTNCFRDTGCEPPSFEDGTPAVVAIVLAENWLCNECLDQVEQDAAAPDEDHP